jgi:hypothetical protein
LQKVDAYDSSLSRGSIAAIVRRHPTDIPLLHIPADPPQEIKTANKFVRRRDKAFRQVQVTATAQLRVTNSGQQALAEGRFEDAAAAFADNAQFSYHLLSTTNEERQRQGMSEATMNAIAPDDTEPLMRDSQKARLHRKAKEAAEARAISAEIQGSIRGRRPWRRGSFSGRGRGSVRGRGGSVRGGFGTAGRGGRGGRGGGRGK